MKTARQHFSRMVQYDKVLGDPKQSMKYALIRFVRGLYKPRAKSVNTNDILEWFIVTPDYFVLNAIQAALDENLIAISPLVGVEAGTPCKYVMLPAGEEFLKAKSKSCDL